MNALFAGVSSKKESSSDEETKEPQIMKYIEKPQPKEDLLSFDSQPSTTAPQMNLLDSFSSTPIHKILPYKPLIINT